MLRVQARFADGGWREVPNFSVTGTAPMTSELLDTARDAAREHSEAAAVLGSVERYLEASIPGLGALREWGSTAVEEFIPYHGERERLDQPHGDAIAWLDGDDLLAVAWQDPTLVAVPVRSEYEALAFEYEPDEEEGIPERLVWDQIEQRSWSPAVELGVQHLDWQGYFGRDTALILGRTVLRRTRKAARRAVIELAGSTGIILAKVSTWLGRAAELDADPSFRSRLQAHERAFPAVAQSCPEIAGPRDATPVQSCIVFVHGTVSCGIRSLARLPSFPPALTLRYEHDTFKPISTNAEELAGLVASLGCDRVLLAGHSRGGLVARRAGHLLDLDGYAGQIFVSTYGTPHAGTPIVTAVTPVGAFYMLEALDDPDVPVRDAVTAAFSYLARPGAPPDGIAAMRPGSDFLQMLNRGRAAEPWPLTAYGGAYDLDAPGVGVAFKGRFAESIFAGEPNDLVVALASATSAGSPKPLTRSCSHNAYFDDPDVRAALECWS